MLLKGTIAAATMLVVAGCGSGGTAPRGGTAATPTQPLSFCQHVAGLHADLETLTPVHGSLPTSSQLKATAQDIQTNLSGLGRQTQWQTQINNASTAAANLNSAADNIAASPGARGAAAQVTSAAAQASTSLRRLLTAVGSRCPSPSPGSS